MTKLIKNLNNYILGKEQCHVVSDFDDVNDKKLYHMLYGNPTSGRLAITIRLPKDSVFNKPNFASVRLVEPIPMFIVFPDRNYDNVNISLTNRNTLEPRISSLTISFIEK